MSLEAHIPNLAHVPTKHVTTKIVESHSLSKINVFHMYKLKRGRKYKHRVDWSKNYTRRLAVISPLKRKISVVRTNLTHLQYARLGTNHSIHLLQPVTQSNDPWKELHHVREQKVVDHNQMMLEKYTKSTYSKVDTNNDVMPIRVNPERIYRRLLRDKFVKKPSLEE